jgi:hypothetical protein
MDRLTLISLALLCVGFIFSVIGFIVWIFDKAQSHRRLHIALTLAGMVAQFVGGFGLYIDSAKAQARLSARNLSDAQIVSIARGIEAFHGTDVHLFLDPYTAETYKLFEELGAFKVANWNPATFQSCPAGGQAPVEGIVIEYSAKDEEMHKAALALLKALTRKSVGLAAKARRTRGVPMDPSSNWVELRIGEHPFLASH